MKYFIFCLISVLMGNAAIVNAQPIYRLKEKSTDFYFRKLSSATEKTTYHYSGNRGGVFYDAPEMIQYYYYFSDPFWDMKYDSSVRMTNDGIGKPLKYYGTTVQLFDNADRITSVSTGPNSLASFFYTGSALDSIVSVHDNGKMVWRYDNAGNVKELSAHSNSSSPPSILTIYYTYNAGLLSEIYYDRTDYRERTTFAYNSTGEITERLIKDDKSGTEDTVRFFTYKYTAPGMLDTIYEHTKTNIVPLTLSTAMVYLYDNSNKLSGTEYYRWNDTTKAMDTMLRTMFQYNSFGFVSNFKEQQYDSFGKWNNAGYDPTWWLRDETYVYEMYWPVSVTTQIAGGVVLGIYPSPARDVITIETTFHTTQPITATIADMQGRILRTWSEPSTKEYRRTIPVADLPVGNYILKLNEMVKQFVVR